MDNLSHFDDRGNARMVDVSGKVPSFRTARAHAFVKMRPEVIDSLPRNEKGSPLEVARIAGVMAAKNTASLIPLCHPLPLTYADVRLETTLDGIRIFSDVATNGPTGVEMEALTAVAVAALTVYDMTKALDKAIEIQHIYLVEKTGGKSGGYKRKDSWPDTK